MSNFVFSSSIRGLTSINLRCKCMIQLSTFLINKRAHEYLRCLPCLSWCPWGYRPARWDEAMEWHESFGQVSGFFRNSHIKLVQSYRLFSKNRHTWSSLSLILRTNNMTLVAGFLQLRHLLNFSTTWTTSEEWQRSEISVTERKTWSTPLIMCRMKININTPMKYHPQKQTVTSTIQFTLKVNYAKLRSQKIQFFG